MAKSSSAAAADREKSMTRKRGKDEIAAGGPMAKQSEKEPRIQQKYLDMLYQKMIAMQAKDESPPVEPLAVHETGAEAPKRTAAHLDDANIPAKQSNKEPRIQSRYLEMLTKRREFCRARMLAQLRTTVSKRHFAATSNYCRQLKRYFHPPIIMPRATRLRHRKCAADTSRPPPDSAAPPPPDSAAPPPPDIGAPPPPDIGAPPPPDIGAPPPPDSAARGLVGCQQWFGIVIASIQVLIGLMLILGIVVGVALMVYVF